MIIKICEYLSNCKDKYKYSYGQMEKKCKVTKTMIHSLEGRKGLNINPTVKTLKKVLSCYDKTLFDLFKYVYKEK